jgi:uncharacterized membrane protein YdfJ with MMPL/SSD domain
MTSAAVIMVRCSRSRHADQRDQAARVGLAVAILLDATLIRVVLLPSVMALLGDRNWYLPRWLAQMPGISHRSTGLSAPAGLPSPEPSQAWPTHAGARG